LEVEQLGRVARLSVKVLESAVEGLVEGLLGCFGSEKLSLFIENDWSVLELSILSIRFRALGLPSLSFRFRVRVDLEQGLISFYLGSSHSSLEGF